MGDNPKDICSICLEEIGEDDCVKTKCGHSFHFSCMYKNIKKNKRSGDKCPLCREKYIKPKPPKVRRRENLLSNRGQFYRSVFRSVNILNSNINSILTVPYSSRSPRIQPLVTKESIKRYIDVLSFEELKNHNLSTRGYRRATLEKRLKRHLLRVNLMREI